MGQIPWLLRFYSTWFWREEVFFWTEDNCILLSGNIELFSMKRYTQDESHQRGRQVTKLFPSYISTLLYSALWCLSWDSKPHFCFATLLPVWIFHRGGARGSSRVGRGRKDSYFLISSHGLQFFVVPTMWSQQHFTPAAVVLLCVVVESSLKFFQHLQN